MAEKFGGYSTSKIFNLSSEYRNFLYTFIVLIMFPEQENNIFGSMYIIFFPFSRWAHQVTSLFRNIAVNIWWTPLHRFNATDCKGMKNSFGSFLIYKNSIFALISASLSCLLELAVGISTSFPGPLVFDF